MIDFVLERKIDNMRIFMSSESKVNDEIKKIKDNIRKEKKLLRQKRLEKFKKSKIYKFIKKIEKKDYHKSYKRNSLMYIFIGFLSCFLILGIITRGKNIFRLSFELSKFFEVYDTLTNKYYNDVDKEKLIDNAISGMVGSVGDTYTGYADKDNADEFNEMVEGVYEGIGCTIGQYADRIEVMEVYENGPADKAGIKKGDILLKVDDLDALEEGITEVSNYVKNLNSSEVKVKIKRGEEELDVTIVRGKVEIPVVESKIIEKDDKKVGYISISIFSSVSYKQFKEKLEILEKEDIEGLVIDVRDNNGGHLNSVTDIVSMFLEKGSVIYQTEKDGRRKKTKDKTKEMREYPVSVLVNGSSASASEILAASIKESYHGYIVGTKTFGKGTVQQVKTLSDGSFIKYTIENWLSPKGNWIDKAGVEPTKIVELNEKYYETLDDNDDNQLQTAVDLIIKK